MEHSSCVVVPDPAGTPVHALREDAHAPWWNLVQPPAPSWRSTGWCCFECIVFLLLFLRTLQLQSLVHWFFDLCIAGLLFFASFWLVESCHLVMMVVVVVVLEATSKQVSKQARSDSRWWWFVLNFLHIYHKFLNKIQTRTLSGVLLVTHFYFFLKFPPLGVILLACCWSTVYTWCNSISLLHHVHPSVRPTSSILHLLRHTPGTYP